MEDISIKNKIGDELIYLIKTNSSILQMAIWAERVYSNYCRDLDSETDVLITKISFMQHGPEFEISKADLEIIAKKLISKEVEE